MLGYSLYRSGKLDEALAAHQKDTEYPATAGVVCYHIACVIALRGKTNEVFAWLKKAVANGLATSNTWMATPT